MHATAPRLETVQLQKKLCNFRRNCATSESARECAVCVKTHSLAPGNRNLSTQAEQHEAITSKQADQRQIRAVLRRVRSRIRWYVWLEGIAVALIWLSLTFWVAFGLDYLPVLLGLSEMPWQARAVILTLIGLALAFILYRWILRRAFVRFSDRSLALLLERRFGQFQDGLVTSIEFTEKGHEKFDSQMIQHTAEEAGQRIGDVEISKVFNKRPLAVAMTLALLLLLTIALFGAINQKALALSGKRIYLLETEPWPRSAHIELVGVRVKRDQPIPGLPGMPDIIPFRERAVRVSKGANVELIARADADVEANPNRTIPRSCTFSYIASEGERGRQEMNKVGRPREGFQDYTYNQQPLKGILSSLKFDVRGGDHRIGKFQIIVVDSPAVIATELDCRFPEYMVDEESGSWTARTIKLTPGTQLPIGTSVAMRVISSKALQRAFLYDPKTKETQTIEIGGVAPLDRFEIELPIIREDVTWDVTLLDAEGLLSDVPQRVHISAVADKAPKIAARLEGIGTAITPDVRIPFSGKVTDEYGVKQTWVEFQLPDADPRRAYFDLPKDGTLSAAVDFKELARSDSDPVKLQPREKNRLSILIKANDNFNLNGPANEGAGDRFVLDIVTADEMSRILERLEVGQRRRLEQIYQEMTDANEYLLRAKIGNELSDLATEPGDQSADGSASTEDSSGQDSTDEQIEAGELKILYAQRALLQTRKSRQEILGVSETFLNIRDQLVNNRLDKKNKKSRLEQDIAQPLRKIGEATMPELELRIEALEAKLTEIGREYNEKNEEQVDLAAAAAIEQASLTLRQIDNVLRILIKYESYSELLEVVRQMYEEQKNLLEATKKERKRQQLGDLLK